jgi:hypothetical protein
MIRLANMFVFVGMLAVSHCSARTIAAGDADAAADAGPCPSNPNDEFPSVPIIAKRVVCKAACDIESPTAVFCIGIVAQPLSACYANLQTGSLYEVSSIPRTYPGFRECTREEGVQLQAAKADAGR